jgi:hypothetical protein
VKISSATNCKESRVFFANCLMYPHCQSSMRN